MNLIPTVKADIPTLAEDRVDVGCRICDSRRFSPFLEAHNYCIVECLDCGLRYVNPQPSDRELADFYNRFDEENSWRGKAEEEFDRAMRKLILRFQNGGAVLDIGSSKGNFLISMRNAGFAIYGVEPSARNAEFARAVNGIPTCTGTVEEFLLTPVRQQVNVITLLNVLEHLRDPKRVLLKLRERLVDGGLVIIVVPDARFHAVLGSARWKLGFSDPYWMNQRLLVGFDPPQHLCSFEPRTITLLLERCGYRKVALRNAPVISRGSVGRVAVKKVVRAFSELFRYLSFGQLVVGYSTVMVARKVTT